MLRDSMLRKIQQLVDQEVEPLDVAPENRRIAPGIAVRRRQHAVLQRRDHRKRRLELIGDAAEQIEFHGIEPIAGLALTAGLLDQRPGMPLPPHQPHELPDDQPQHQRIERDHPSAEQHRRPDPEGDPLFGQHLAVVRHQPHRQAVTAGGQSRIGDLSLRAQFVPVVVEILQPVAARIGRRAEDVVIDHRNLEGQEGLFVGQCDFVRVVDGEFQHVASDLHGFVEKFQPGDEERRLLPEVAFELCGPETDQSVRRPEADLAFAAHIPGTDIEFVDSHTFGKTKTPQDSGRVEPEEVVARRQPQVAGRHRPASRRSRH